MRRIFMKALLLASCSLLMGPLSALAAKPAAKPAAEMPPPRPISMSQADKLLGQQGVYFLDANTPEIWETAGHLPGAIFINKPNWTKLLPKDKEAVLVFYCANRLCYASTDAAMEAQKKGYANVYLMPEGVYGWIGSGRPIEKDAPKGKG